MTTRELALRDLREYWRGVQEGEDLRNMCSGRRPSGGPGSAHPPRWFADALRRGFRQRDITALANTAWATSRGHVDSFKTLLKDMAEAVYRQPDQLSAQDLRRLAWRNQKRRYRAWKRQELEIRVST